MPLFAAEANTSDVPVAEATDEVGQDTGSGSANGSASAADQADEQEAEEESPARFIPTEQISQDLGVSFPADI